MTYRGHVAQGRIVLDKAQQLPEGATVQVEILETKARITRPMSRQRLRKVQPITMPGGSLADELIRNRR